jgi:hypothetical protein
MWCYTTDLPSVNTQLPSSPYRGDPFCYLRIIDKYLHLGPQKVASSNINKIALYINGDKAYLSLPYNHLKGQAPTLYFDKGFYKSVHAYLSKDLPDAQFIE